MNPLVTPDIGLVFWTTVSFLVLFFLLAKFAWKPIMGALDERERFIEDSLSKAEAAKEEMSRLTARTKLYLNKHVLSAMRFYRKLKRLKTRS
jgi:F-type H+-transporting ATPase subunit b